MKRRKSIITIGLLVAILASTGCQEDTIGDESFGTLEGTVVSNGDNEPIPNVKITTNPVSTTVFTDDNGEFIIAEIAVGEYSVQAELDEYKTAFEPAQISAAKTSTVVFELDSVDVDNVPPGTPELLFPEDGAMGIPTSTEFQWSSASNDDDEIIYTLELRNGETNQTILYENLKDTTLAVSGLSIGKNYFWQVKATDGINTPVQSDLSSFTVQGVGDNSIYYVRNSDGNNTIFSGREPDPDSEEVNVNEAQLTDASFNSYKPKYNREADKVAFIRSTGEGEQIFTMKPDGTEQRQITSTIPIAGFRNTELEFAWAGNGTEIIYPNFDKLFRVGVNGGGSTLVYQTPDGSLISEVAIPDFDQDLLLIKTNNLDGYQVRIYTYRVSSRTEETVVLEGVTGGAGSIDITANADQVLYSLDTSGSQNSIYRQFSSRLFLYDIALGTATAVDTEVLPGQNDFDAQFSPSEGAIIFVRAANNIGAQTSIFKRQLDEDEDVVVDDLLFTEAFMPDW